MHTLQSTMVQPSWHSLQPWPWQQQQTIFGGGGGGGGGGGCSFFLKQSQQHAHLPDGHAGCSFAGGLWSLQPQVYPPPAGGAGGLGPPLPFPGGSGPKKQCILPGSFVSVILNEFSGPGMPGYGHQVGKFAKGTNVNLD
ncbi:hypothetical protein GQ42DRAFT_165514, partial [Ramicandelaber brevisporus]